MRNDPDPSVHVEKMTTYTVTAMVPHGSGEWNYESLEKGLLALRGANVPTTAEIELGVESISATWRAGD